MERIKIGITQGDINGIGYELILNTFETEEMASICTPIIYGSPKVATYHRKTIGSQTSFQVVDSADAARDGQLNMVNCFGEDEQKIDFGQATEEAGKAALTSLDMALTDLRDGKIAALVTMPLNNATIKRIDGLPFKSQTAYIEETIGEGRKALKIFIANNLRIALATDKIPVAEIPARINKDLLAERLVILHNTLKRDFFIDNPRIAVLAMYYDQGASTFKSIAQNEGINFTAGLPLLRTAPAIGVGYDIAGKCMIDDEQSFRQAIYTAIDVARNRVRFDLERVNPLQKQYVAKRDDSDKLKLDQIEDEE